MVVWKGNCVTCGKAFKKYKKKGSPPAKFCKNSCRRIEKHHGKKECETCGKEFDWYRANGKPPRICSHSCRSGIVRKWKSKHGFTWKNLTKEQLHYQWKVCFEERVERQETCWIWKGSKNSRGYGSFHSDGKGKRILAHRLSWSLHRVEIPDGLVIRHSCNNPICVNPDHLNIGTLQDNSNDRIFAGNSCAGEENFKSKLNEEKVKCIKNLLKSGISGSEIGRRYGVTRSTISSIKKNRTWRHVEL